VPRQVLVQDRSIQYSTDSKGTGGSSPTGKKTIAVEELEDVYTK